MGQKIARIGDSVSCRCLGHKNNLFTGTILTGSNVGTDEGAGIARLDDTGLLTCGHTFKITSASSIFDCDGRGVARIGDSVLCLAGGTGTITTGSTITDSD